MQRYVPVVKPEPKTVVSPSGQIETQHISIKQLMQKSQEQQDAIPVDYSARPTTAYTLDQVKMVWKQFAFRMKEEGMETIYMALSKRDPILMDDHVIKQQFDNQVQIDRMLNNHLNDMLDFVREKLNNWSIRIDFSVADMQDENKKLLTGKDKFEELARKNANLYSLQKTFNLDIDY